MKNLSTMEKIIAQKISLLKIRCEFTFFCDLLEVIFILSPHSALISYDIPALKVKNKIPLFFIIEDLEAELIISSIPLSLKPSWLTLTLNFSFLSDRIQIGRCCWRVSILIVFLQLKHSIVWTLALGVRGLGIAGLGRFEDPLTSSRLLLADPIFDSKSAGKDSFQNHFTFFKSVRVLRELSLTRVVWELGVWLIRRPRIGK